MISKIKVECIELLFEFEEWYYKHADRGSFGDMPVAPPTLNDLLQYVHGRVELYGHDERIRRQDMAEKLGNLDFSFNNAHGFDLINDSGQRCLDHGDVTMSCDPNCTFYDAKSTWHIGDVVSMEIFIKEALAALIEVDRQNEKVGKPRRLRKSFIEKGFLDKIWT